MSHSHTKIPVSWRCLLNVCSWFLGSGPNRGRSPVEWGEILSVHLSVYPFVCLSVRTSVHPPWLALSPCRLALRPCWLALRPLQLAL